MVAGAPSVAADGGEAPVEGFVVRDEPGDDSGAIQAALDQAASAGGGLVYLPDADYQLARPVEIGSATELRLSPRTTVHRATDATWLLTNKHDGVTGGYGQARDITISGGTWDGNGDKYKSSATLMIFGHAERVTVRDAVFRDLGGTFHFVEFNAIRSGRVLNSTFTGLAGTGDPTRPDAAEMVQIDLARSAGAFPPFGPYDFTPTVDLLVQGNTFTDGMRGVGSHSQNAGHPHRDIRIVGNHFENLTSRAVTPMNTDGLVVEGNTAHNVATFFRFDAPPQPIRGITVQNNSVDNDTMQDTAAGRGIAVFGGPDTASRRVADVTISGNVLQGMGKHGITADYSTEVTISGNAVRDTGGSVAGATSSAGIWLYRCANVSLVGNQVVGGASGGSGSDRADVIIGAASGAPGDTAYVSVVGNTIGRLRINAAVLGVMVADNMLAARSNAAAAPNYREHDNVIGGAWAP